MAPFAFSPDPFGTILPSSLMPSLMLPRLRRSTSFYSVENKTLDQQLRTPKSGYKGGQMISMMPWLSNERYCRVQECTKWTASRKQSDGGREGAVRWEKTQKTDHRRIDGRGKLTWLSFRCLAHSSFDIPAARPPLVLPPGTPSCGLAGCRPSPSPPALSPPSPGDPSLPGVR